MWFTCSLGHFLMEKRDLYFNQIHTSKTKHNEKKEGAINLQKINEEN